MVFLGILPLMIKGNEFLFGWSITLVKNSQRISNKFVYWNLYLRFLLEAYIELAIACQLRFLNKILSVIFVFIDVLVQFQPGQKEKQKL